MRTKLSISKLFLLVDNYQSAIEFYTQKLGFVILEDIDLNDEKLADENTQASENRWVVIAPDHSSPIAIALKMATSIKQKQAIGQQAGDGVFFILTTDSFDQQYQFMQSQGVKFLEQPRTEPYGKVVIFEDLYGNKIDLIELTG